MDWVGLAGLIVGLIALLVAFYGIWDVVRKQVKFLVTLERNLVFARELHTKALQLVELGDARRFQSSEMHGLSMLARAIDSKRTLGSVQEYTNNEALVLARELVRRGLAKWPDHVDEHKVDKFLKDWQDDKNAAVLRKIFGDTPLLKPRKDLMD